MHTRGPCFCDYFLLLYLGNTLGAHQGSSVPLPHSISHLPHVEQYEVVQPLRLPISQTLNDPSSSPPLYPETIRYLLGLRDNNFTLHLRRNRHLIGSGYTETYTLANGTEVTEKPEVGQHCFYQGHVEGHQNSVASISTCQGIRGFFQTGSTIHLIEPLDQEKHGINQRRFGITLERRSSPQERHGSTNKRHDSPDKGYGSKKKHNSPHERHGRTNQRYDSPKKGHGSDQKKHGIHQEKHGSTPKRHASGQERSGTNQRRHGSDQERHNSIQERPGGMLKLSDGIHERSGIPQGRHGTTPGKHGSDQEQYDSILKRHDTIQGRASSHWERSGTTQRKYVSSQERGDSTQKKYISGEDRHAIYRQELLKLKYTTCGVSRTSLMGELETMMAALNGPHIWIPGSIPKETHYVELFVVVDYAEYSKYKSLETVRLRVREIVNHVDRLYQEINFRVILTGLEIWDKGDKVTIDSNINLALSSFLRWRANHLAMKWQHDNAQLITGVSFEGTTVGLARLASMCTEGSGGVNYDHSVNPFGVATTLAHEIGHNLGMDHDENIRDCHCENSEERGGCIMSSMFKMVFPQKFSNCSKDNLQKFLGGSIFSSSCLNNLPNLQELVGPVCGNKFLEQGEECDCGPPEECLNQCCNPNNCLLVTGAECTDGACCQGCQVMPAGEICREAQGPCDLTEYCDGQQSKCPENVFKENGSPCPEGYCYNGTCPTYKQQCQALWGKGAERSTDRCFLLELPKGCAEAFYPSREGLNKCNFLYCSRTGTRQPTRQLCTFFLEGEMCDLAMTKSESHDPFVMVAPGTKCDHNKVCYHRRCEDLSIYGAKNCSNKCNNRGICNQKRECHCDPGWAPPYCQKKLSEVTLNMENLRSGNLHRGWLDIKDRRVLVSILVALALLTVVAILMFVFYRCRRGKEERIPRGSSNCSYKSAIGGYP